MASAFRSGLMRQAWQAPAASNRMLSTITSRSSTFRPAFVQSSVPKTARVAAFHASQRRQILPALPQKVEGTTNDPVPVPPPHPAHGSYHWSFERIISAGLVPLCVAPFAAGSLNPVTDSILCALLVVHSHIGFEACITDYFPKRRIPFIHAAFNWVLRIGTVLLGLALYSFETNDVGITEAAKRLWNA